MRDGPRGSETPVLPCACETGSNCAQVTGHASVASQVAGLSQSKTWQHHRCHFRKLILRAILAALARHACTGQQRVGNCESRAEPCTFGLVLRRSCDKKFKLVSSLNNAFRPPSRRSCRDLLPVSSSSTPAPAAAAARPRPRPSSRRGRRCRTRPSGRNRPCWRRRSGGR